MQIKTKPKKKIYGDNDVKNIIVVHSTQYISQIYENNYNFYYFSKNVWLKN